MIYLFAYLLGGVALAGIWAGGPWVFAGAVAAFVGHSSVDLLLNSVRIRPLEGLQKKIALGLLYLAIPFSTLLMASSLWRSLGLLQIIESGALVVDGGISPGLELFGIILSTGIMMGVLAINPAHELIHRQNLWERFFGVYLLMLVNFGQFRINHVDVHHRHVATPMDPTTARKGEILYRYWLRSFVMGLVRAWQFERARLQASGGGFWRNRMLYYLLGAVSGATILFFLGREFSGGSNFVAWKFVEVWFAISLIAILMLQTIDYVEHYGLLRKELKPGVFEAVKPTHSWDSYSVATNAVLFNLGLHSHHHTRSQLHFVDLRDSDVARQLSYGYSVMFLCALVPPLWMRVVRV